MTNPANRTGEETAIRAIVFREGDLYVAQCLEYDICVQAASIPVLLDRLDLTVEAEFATCAEEGRKACDMISQAPNYYHALWDKRSVALRQIAIASPGRQLEVALADLPRAA